MLHLIDSEVLRGCGNLVFLNEVIQFLNNHRLLLHPLNLLLYLLHETEREGEEEEEGEEEGKEKEEEEGEEEQEEEEEEEEGEEEEEEEEEEGEEEEEEKYSTVQYTVPLYKGYRA